MSELVGDKIRTLKIMLVNHKHCLTYMVYDDGFFVSSQNTNNVIRNWISGRYSRLKVRFGWLPLHPTIYIMRNWLHKCGLYESYKIAADSDWLVRSLYEMHSKVSYLNEYIVRMRIGELSTDPQKVKRKWKEDIRVYRSHKIHPYFALFCKICKNIILTMCNVSNFR